MKMNSLLVLFGAVFTSIYAQSYIEQKPAHTDGKNTSQAYKLEEQDMIREGTLKNSLDDCAQALVGLTVFIEDKKSHSLFDKKFNSAAEALDHIKLNILKNHVADIEDLCNDVGVVLEKNDIDAILASKK